MISRESYSLFQAAKEIRIALVTDGDRIGGVLNEQHPLPVRRGEPVFDYRRHMQHLVVQLDSSVDTVTEAEGEHSSQTIRVSRFKTERDDSANAGYDKLVYSRQGLESLFKRGGFELGHLLGDTPRVPDRLLEQLGQTVKLLQQPAVAPRELKVRGFGVDFDDVASELETRRVDLREAIGRLDGARKVAEGTLVVKQKAIVNLRRTVLWVGRTTEGLFHLAGEHELAERIRSSTRRPLRPSEKATEDQAAENAGSGDEPAAEAGSGDEPAAQPGESLT